MNPRSLLLAALVILCHVSGCHGYSASRNRIQEEADQVEEELEHLMAGSAPTFVNEWAVRLSGGAPVANQVAADLGYINKGQIGALDDFFLLVKDDHPHRSKRSADHHTRSLESDHRVTWVEQQFSKIRVKRDFVDKRQEARAYRSVRYDDSYWGRQWYLGSKRKRRSTKTNKEGDADRTISYDDPDYKDEWYLVTDDYDSRNTSPKSKMDLRVVPTWYRNITGRGVTVCVVDDGMDHEHPDLAPNYNAAASYDFNGDRADPKPRYDKKDSNKHGTRCAGEIAMVANNGICGVGVAYNAQICGIRMLDGLVTDSIESKALMYGIDHGGTDIVTCSWGPSDNGRTVEGPGKLATHAFEAGTTKGRNGKGLIYVWASGNGGQNNDNCDCDGYTGDIHTISISSASENQKAPWYSEQCASTMATTYSSGEVLERKIVSTDLHDQCTLEHTGTSASAPLAAGVMALVLEANPDLTWRDMQHLVVWTSEYDPLKDNPGWKENAAGLRVNNKFGFGLINADSLVTSADPATFQRVPEKSICTVDSSKEDSQGFPISLCSGQEVVLKITTSGCKDQDNEVRYLEHVQVLLSATYSKRGALEISLTSPSNTTTVLLSRRDRDHSDKGFTSWSFMSVQTWGEDPEGTWLLSIKDEKHGNSGHVDDVELVLHGTKEMPHHMEEAGGRRKYDSEFIKSGGINKSAFYNNLPTFDEPIESQNTNQPFNQIQSLENKLKVSSQKQTLSSDATDSTANKSQILREKFRESLKELKQYIDIPTLKENNDQMNYNNEEPHVVNQYVDIYDNDDFLKSQNQPDENLNIQNPSPFYDPSVYNADTESSPYWTLDTDPYYSDYIYPSDPDLPPELNWNTNDLQEMSQS